MMPDTYYRNVRPEMLPFLPAAASTVLELGCAEGVFAAAVKKRFDAQVWGIESNADAAEHAAAVIDHVLVGDADERIAELPDTYFDLVICNDILEHLVDPGATLVRLRRTLKSEGVVVASIPNIRYLSALRALLLDADFPQEDEGIFDRTHLRFFTRKSIIRLFETAGYTVERMEGINANRCVRWRLAVALSFGLFADGFYLQYACVASP